MLYFKYIIYDALHDVSFNNYILVSFFFGWFIIDGKSYFLIMLMLIFLISFLILKLLKINNYKNNIKEIADGNSCMELEVLQILQKSKFQKYIISDNSVSLCKNSLGEHFRCEFSPSCHEYFKVGSQIKLFKNPLRENEFVCFRHHWITIFKREKLDYNSSVFAIAKSITSRCMRDTRAYKTSMGE